MPDSFDESQVGKRVVSQAGAKIGTVSDVRDGSLYVEVRVGDADDTIDHLGWNRGADQSVHRLPSRFVSTVTDEVVRLRV